MDSMRRRMATLGPVFAAAALALVHGGACGGSEGLDHRWLGSLSPAELQALCDDLREGPIRDIARGTLRVTCFFVEIMRPTCSDERAERCVEEAMRELPEEGGACFDERFDPLRCDITVGELKACYAELAETLSTAAARLSCERFAVDRAALSTLPPSCQAVQARCPSLLTGD